LALLKTIDAPLDEVLEHYRSPQTPPQPPALASQRASLPRPSERRLRAARKAVAKLVRGE
jgi:hypothetical protein